MHELARSLRLASVGNALFLRVSRVVRRIDIIDLPRADPVKLNYRIAFRPRRVFHSSGPVTEGPCRKFFCAIAIKRFSGREMKSTRNHRDALSFWMGMRCDMIAVRELKRTTNGPSFVGSPSSTAIFAPGGKAAGPAFHSMVSEQGKDACPSIACLRLDFVLLIAIEENNGEEPQSMRKQE